MSGLVYRDPSRAVAWALSGFSHNLAWLIFASVVLASGYEKTGLGKRLALWLITRLGRHTLGLGYAVALADLLLSPITPSNTARSAGTIYPVIRNVPVIYGSRSGVTAQKMGAYLMYTAFASTCVTSSMFPTALAANLLAVGLIAQTIDESISWREWALGFLPVGITLLALMRLLLYVIYRPESRRTSEAPAWAAAELKRMGRMSVLELAMAGSMLTVITLWIGGSRYTDATTAAILGVVFLVARSIVSWDDVLGNKQAWSLLVWFSTLVTLASGLGQVKFVDWVAATIEPHFARLPWWLAIAFIVGTFYLTHYLFATASGHATALLPVFLAVAVALPRLTPKAWGLVLSYTLGLMGILTPYATGPSPIYYTCGYIRKRDFWVYGSVLGGLFLSIYLLVGIPWLLWRQP